VRTRRDACAKFGIVIAFLIRAAIFLGSSALGLIVADLLLPGFVIHWSNPLGFLLAIVIFTILQSVLSPWILKVTTRHASPLIGGIGIVSTFVSLFVVVLIPAAGLGISDLTAWFLAPLIVWIVTALATWLLPRFLIKEKVADKTAAKRA
jgi:hypothetical protein